jgi:hypothetical protein
MFQQIFYGIMGIVVGVALVVYARKLVEWFGTMATAERFFGFGGTYTALRIIGIFTSIISFLYMVGFLDNAVIGALRSIGLIN